MLYILPNRQKRKFSYMSQIQEDSDLKDIEDPEYNRLLDNAVKKHRSSKDDIIEAARRLEDLG